MQNSTRFDRPLRLSNASGVVF